MFLAIDILSGIELAKKTSRSALTIFKYSTVLSITVGKQQDWTLPSLEGHLPGLGGRGTGVEIGGKAHWGDICKLMADLLGLADQ